MGSLPKSDPAHSAPHFFAGFSSRYGHFGIAIGAAIPIWILLIEFRSSASAMPFAVLLSILIGLVEGFILVCIALQLSTREGRAEIDRFYQFIASNSAKTNATFITILFGIPANWYLMALFPGKTGAYLIRANIAAALAVLLQHFAFKWVDSWGKGNKKN
jgi:hypothetical protein